VELSEFSVLRFSDMFPTCSSSDIWKLRRKTYDDAIMHPKHVHWIFIVFCGKKKYETQYVDRESNTQLNALLG